MLPDKKLNSILFYLSSMAIMMVAFFLRLEDIAVQPLTVDEATIAGFARGVVEKGYPYLMVGDMEVKLATYEIVPYFIALSIKILGYSDFALRVPALIFGTLTVSLIIFAGKNWFGRSVGILAGILYAVSPWAIYWSQNCFHPAQTQFSTLLAILVFQRLIDTENISLRLAIGSALAFTFSYLSWEGIGLVLPIMAFVAFYIRWSQWKWFAQINLWIAGLLITMMVAAQIIRRTLLQSPYIMVGSGKGDMTGPQLTFTDPSYQPFYYIQNFFLSETHLALSLIFIAGLVLMFFDRKLSFAVSFVVISYLSLTNMLGYYNAHYIYFVLPVFLLAVAATFIKIIMLLSDLAEQHKGIMARVQLVLVSILLTGLLLIPSTSNGLKLYHTLTSMVDRQRIDYRPDLVGVDSRAPSRILNERFQPGDIIIVTVPLILEHYTGKKGDYFIQTITDRKVVYDTVSESPFYVDKFVGNPVLRSQQELEDVLQRHARVWFLAAPARGLNRIIDEQTLAYIKRNMQVVFESYDSTLYLWEK